MLSIKVKPRASGYKTLILAGFCLLFAMVAQAIPPAFTPGDLAVLRLGNGTEVLANSGNSMFIDEFSPAASNTAPAFTAAISNSGPNALVLEGTAASEGGLTLSLDRTVLAVCGYNTNADSSPKIDASNSIAIPRGFGTVDAYGSYLLQGTTPQFFTAQNPRFVTTDGTNDFWMVGGASGVVYFDPQNSTAEAINTSVANNRAIRSFNGNLYFSSQKSSPIGIYELAGLPTGIGPLTNLVIATGSSSTPSDFAMNPASNVVYVADINTGVQKWTFNGSAWSLAYTFPLAAAGTQPVGAFALTVDFSGANPVIYTTTLETNSTSASQPAGNHLVKIVDTNSSAAVVYLAQAPTNEVYRGIDFAPSLLPQITTQPLASQSVAFNAAAGISVAATSPFSLNYQWQHNGTNLIGTANITDVTAATLNIAHAAATNAGNYTVIVSDNYGAVTSSISVLTVAMALPPNIITQPAAFTTNFIGDTASLTVVGGGVPSPTYQWYQYTGFYTQLSDGPGANGETFSGTTNATLNIINVQTNDAVQYVVALTNPGGTTNSQLASLIVNLIPPGIATQPAPQTTIIGQTVNLSVTATGSYLTYQWMQVTNGMTNALSDITYPSGEAVTGSATAALQIANAQTNDTGLYFLVVSNTVAATNSAAVAVSVIPTPPPSFISYSSPGMTYTQNFNSLPAPTNVIGTLAAANPLVINGVTYQFGSADPIDFAAPILSQAGASGGLGLAATMSGWYGWTGTNTFNRIGVNCGDYTTGGIQDYGSTNSLTASTNRSLGLITTSSSLNAAFAARLVNNTGTTLSNMNLSFTGVIWRQSSVAKNLVFFYVVDPTGTASFDTNTADYTSVPALNVNFPTVSADSGGTNVDGTQPANQEPFSVSNQTITNWTPGAALWLIWEYQTTTGKAQGIGIDNLSFSAGQAVSNPPLSIGPIVVSNSIVTLSFTNSTGLTVSVLATNNITAPRATWPVIGTATENPTGSGQYQFTDPTPATGAARYYTLHH